uniref:Uncharacterized protein n=1 Tax=Zea mays TaxID=4577 RepID=C0P6W7_MAIZE|nr:unknown [Zea mays]
MFWFSMMKDPQWLDLCGNNAATVFSLFFFFAKTSQSGLDGSISEDDRSILVANIWPLPKHLTWVMTCPEHIQKLPVVNQPGIILNLIGSRETVRQCQSSLLRKHSSNELCCIQT